MISPDGFLKKQKIHGLRYDVTIAPCSILLLVLHEFHNSKGHQGKYIYLRQLEDSASGLKYAKILFNILTSVIYEEKPTAAFRNSQSPSTILAMDTIGHLSVTYRGY